MPLLTPVYRAALPAAARQGPEDGVRSQSPPPWYDAKKVRMIYWVLGPTDTNSTMANPTNSINHQSLLTKTAVLGEAAAADGSSAVGGFSTSLTKPVAIV